MTLEIGSGMLLALPARPFVDASNRVLLAGSVSESGFARPLSFFPPITGSPIVYLNFEIFSSTGSKYG
jgi:hypothetical protein